MGGLGTKILQQLTSDSEDADLLAEALGMAEEENGSETGGSKKGTQAQELIALAAGVELFHTPDETCYATVVINGHNETLPIRAKSHNSSGGGFRRWLLREFYERQGKPPGASADAPKTLLYPGN